MKSHNKNPLFEGLCYNHKGFELFSKANFESSWEFEGLKSDHIKYFLLPFRFLASTFLVPTPLIRSPSNSNIHFKTLSSNTVKLSKKFYFKNMLFMFIYLSAFYESTPTHVMTKNLSQTLLLIFLIQPKSCLI